jgi:hypothetical protein
MTLLIQFRIRYPCASEDGTRSMGLSGLIIVGLFVFSMVAAVVTMVAKLILQFVGAASSPRSPSKAPRS